MGGPGPAEVPWERSVKQDHDLCVVGGGFGGLATALEAAERGARVVLCETLSYPGGCASTFVRDGYHFEAGATLFSGLGEGQLFRRWIERYRLDVEVDWLDPVVELRSPDGVLEVGRSRPALVQSFASMPGAPRRDIERFFAMQKRVADVLWSVLDEPELLPPFDLKSLLTHARRLPRYLPFLRWVGQPLEAVLRAHGLADFQPLRTYLDGLCQITVQCGVAEAEAPFALGTMDYYWRGTGHVRGGIGVLARGLVQAIQHAGGEVRLGCRVKSLEREADAWRVETRQGTLRCGQVATNLLPGAVRALTEASLPASINRLEEEVADGWGACMLYRVVRPPSGTGPHPVHLQLVLAPGLPLMEGNHLFCSISGEGDHGRAPEGWRTMTVSTHVPMRSYLALSGEERARYVGEVQDRMRRTLAEQAPEWEVGLLHELSASPRTFERFTGRPEGFVGGVPRRTGLGHYRPPRSKDLLPGLHRVGDSVFPGQSTLATALGGVRLARRLTFPVGSR